MTDLKDIQGAEPPSRCWGTPTYAPHCSCPLQPATANISESCLEDTHVWLYKRQARKHQGVSTPGSGPPPTSDERRWDNSECLMQRTQMDCISSAYSGNLLINTPCPGSSPFPVSLPHSPNSPSWNHLPSKLLALRSLF